MPHETTQEQVPARVEKPASAGKPEQPKAHASSDAAVIELTDTGLPAVNGGGSKPGIGSGSNEQ